jgi:hypothetical protein
MFDSHKAHQLALALAQSPLPTIEKEEWAVFSAVLSEQQVDELINLLTHQSADRAEELKRLRFQG